MKAWFLIPGRLARVLALAAVIAAGSASAETLVWTGAASSDWNLTDLNWTNELGEATAWVNGSSATFTECGSAALTISVTDDIQLHNLMLTRTSPAVTWNDGGGSLTFVSDERQLRGTARQKRGRRDTPLQRREQPDGRCLCRL